MAPIAAGSSPERYAALAALLAVLVGGMALIGGIARIGFLADFVSKPILMGYMIGVALVIISSQLGRLFGVSAQGDNFFQRIWSLLTQLGQTSVPTLIFGLVLIAFLMVLRRIARRLPGALIVVVFTTLISAIFHFQQLGISVVGRIPGGLPHLVLPAISLHDVFVLLPSALSLTLIIFTDVILSARSFAERSGDTVEPNQELIGLAAANLMTGLLQGIPAGFSQSRTVVNIDSGGKTQLVGLVAVACLAIFLLWFTPLLESLPQVALAAIIISAAINLINFNPLFQVYRERRSEFLLGMLTLLGVLSVGVLWGILGAVTISLLVVISRISRPHDAVLGSAGDVDG